jgi:probable F420-dependent oxidoreductase
MTGVLTASRATHRRSVKEWSAMGGDGVRLAVTLSHLEGISAPKQQDLLTLARDAEDAGAAQLVLSEHVVLAAEITGHPPVRPGDPPITTFFPSDEEYPEPLVTLAAIAAATTRVRLSTNILIAPLRPPVLLAKMAATLDVLSGGRLDLGVGAGWHRPEFEAIGVPYRDLALRTEEAVAACRALWAGGPSSYTGQTVAFHDVYCSPTPLQSPLPVLFGGQPNESTARLVATLGDGWSPIGGTTPDEIRRGIGFIRDAAARMDRDPATFTVRCSLPLRRGPDERPSLRATLDTAAQYVDAGVRVVQLPPLRHFLEGSADPLGAAREVVAEAAQAVAEV